jgi:hypothetical protein
VCRSGLKLGVGEKKKNALCVHARSIRKMAFARALCCVVLIMVARAGDDQLAIEKVGTVGSLP